MSFLRQLSRPRHIVCQQCTLRYNIRAFARAARRKSPPTKKERIVAQELQWEEQAGRVRAGMQPSMLSVLEERGFVKDIAGGRQDLDWLLTKKRIGVYVGVDPTAPSLHVGHLLPLMALYWMYLYGYNTYSLLGGGTVQIGDPSGRTTARSSQATDVRIMNTESIWNGLNLLWTNVKCLGIKHGYPQEMWKQGSNVLNNHWWLDKLSAVELMRSIGSGMRLGPMLGRDSVKVRMESGEGMAFSEFSYPLFQAYDWWYMYRSQSVQLQIGGSDQYGNIVAGMDAVSHMRKIHRPNDDIVKDEEPSFATYGLTTPLLTTASGEKFGKSAGNAVWLDPDMMDSFHLYQYFLRTADDDVERYLKLFTFMPLSDIALLMAKQRQDESKRLAQHILAKELVELAHGAAAARKAESAHKEAFSSGTNTFALGAVRTALASGKKAEESDNMETKIRKENHVARKLLAYKKSYAASPTAPVNTVSTTDAPHNSLENVAVIPITMLEPGSFPRILFAVGLVNSKSEAHRLIAKKGAYVVVPNSGTTENPTMLQWSTIEPGVAMNPNHFLVDWEALVLRSGKSKIQIVRVVPEDEFIKQGLTCPGWDEIRAKRIEESPTQA